MEGEKPFSIFQLLSSHFKKRWPFPDTSPDIFQYFDSGSQYQYIRPNTNYNSPVTDLSSTDLRCNVGGLTGSGTATATVQAGSTHTFKE